MSIDIFCFVGLAAFAVLALWANWRWRRETANLSPQARDEFKRSANDEMAVW